MLFWRLHRAARIVFSLNYQLGKWPLYQVAYMIGGLQFRALNKELVEGGRMTASDFHDAILQGGYMPVELVRARLMG